MQDLNKRVVRRFLTALHTVGDTIERGTLRIHRFRDSVKLTDLTNAGKRGGKVNVCSVSTPYGRQDSLYDLTEQLETVSSFDAARAIVETFVQENDKAGSLTSYDVDMGWLRGVDVMPAGFKPLVINGKYTHVTAEWKSFSIRDKVDMNNEPSCIPAIKGGLRSIPVFYRWVKENASRIEDMKFHEILHEMQKIGVDYHSYCAMD